MKKLISIIVPVYKVAKYLPRCIESILRQTYPNFELILVDDGSPDKSGKICDKYAQKDSRIRVIHKKNGGVSSARNAGLDIAQGEYISFIDSDDWVSRDYLEKLVLPIGEDGVQLVVGGIDTRRLEIRETKLKNIKYDLKKVTKEECHWFFIKNPVGSRGPCAKLYKNEILQENKLRFDETIHWGEDTIFFYQYCALVEKMCLVEGVIYHYNKLVKGSATRGRDRKRLAFGQIIQKNFEKMIECFGLSVGEKNQIIQEYKIGTFFLGVSEICSSKENTLEDLQNYYKQLEPWDLKGQESKIQEVSALINGDIKKIFEICRFRESVFWKRLVKKLYSQTVQKMRIYYLERHRDELKKLRTTK